MGERGTVKSGWALLVGAVMIGCLVGMALTALVMWPGGLRHAEAAQTRVAPESQQLIVEAIKKVGPAVVNIATELPPPTAGLPPELAPFFGQPFPRQGQASGVIIDRQGYILTNNHVVEGATSVKVRLADGRTFSAKVVGTDPLSDIGVVRIGSDNLPVAQLGTSEDKPVGSWVIAIGNPFAYENTATVGVLSARNRNLTAPNGVGLEHLLQTDAAINPGNSGGALVDIEGRVIGMPTAIIEYAQGIGFAISAETLRAVSQQLIATGHVSHPWLGVYYVAVTEDIQRELKLPDRKGVAVAEVAPGSPAAGAGVKAKDVIVRIGGREITDPQVVADAMQQSRVGQRLELIVRRAGKELPVSVTIGERPAPQPGG